MLEAENVSFRVGSKALVQGVTATFPPGQLHLIIGPNGAGKSTLLKLLARLLRPSEGAVSYNGADAASWSEAHLARQRAVLSQAVEIAFPLPVHELVMMGRYPHRGRSSAASDERVCREVIDYFDLAEFATRNYATLSGGERQRVNFARVLAQIWSPTPGALRYLFLDEPLTFLDIRHQIDFMQKIRRFASASDVVVVGVVHDLNLAAAFAGQLLLLHEGRVLSHGPASAVLTPQMLERAFQVSPLISTNPVTGSLLLSFQ